MSIILEKMLIERFRNIHGDFELIFQKGINLISGHNGVGKSNILSLIASGTGIAKSGSPTNNNFQPEFYNYFNINSEEVISSYKIYSFYKKNKEDILVKFLRFKDDTASDRSVRIIPTSYNYSNVFQNQKELTEYSRTTFLAGYEARIPIPTRYISISRLLPLGESDLNQTTFKNNNKIIKAKLNKVYRDYYNSVLPNSILPDAKMYSSTKKNTNSKFMGMEVLNASNDTKSVGQDSLDYIISTLVDFNWLKTELGEKYNGGILCIDEVDISLHPVAQIKLIDLLERCSQELNLQIFITTHSLTIIKEISKKIKYSQKRDIPVEHSVNYIKDKDLPMITKNNDYESIKADMFLESKVIVPKVTVYFEDSKGCDLHKNLMKTAQNILEAYYNEDDYNYIAAKLSKTHLRYLSSKDGDPTYFNTVAIVLDGDSKLKESAPSKIQERLENKNVTIDNNEKFNEIMLPDVLPPEAYIYMIFSHYVESKDKIEAMEFWKQIDEIFPEAPSREYFINENFLLNDKEKITIDKIKTFGKLDEITQFVYDHKVLDFYYKFDPIRLSELQNYVSRFESVTNLLRKKILNKHF